VPCKGSLLHAHPGTGDLARFLRHLGVRRGYQSLVAFVDLVVRNGGAPMQQTVDVAENRAVVDANRAIQAVLSSLFASGEDVVLESATWSGTTSNDVFELRLRDGRTVMLKQARHEWARDRFVASRRAARLLRDHTDVEAPRPIDLPDDPDGPPVHAYWRIQLPTLDRVWPSLHPRARLAAVDSLGSLLACLHTVPTSSWGRLAAEGEPVSLQDFLGWDLGGRLLPALHAIWPEASEPVERLRRLVPDLVSRVGDRPPTLAHNDVHMGNVLCRVEAEGVRCVGLLDLEASCSLPAESDAASLLVLHGPLFEQALERRWRAAALRAHGFPFDPWAVSFFEAMHLANLGFHSALLGHAVHAAQVRRALQRSVDRL
jgi:aminoglycoside phosphotransferase (APT) family kinase protein